MILDEVDDNRLSIWDLSDAMSPKSYDVLNPGFFCQSYALDLSFAVFSSRGGRSFELWDFGAVAGAKRCETKTGYETPASSVIRPDQRQFATVGGMKNALGKFIPEIKLWEVTSGEPVLLQEFRLHNEIFPLPYDAHVPSLHYSRDGETLIVCGADGWVVFWNVAHQKITREWRLPPSYRWGDIAPDGRHIAVRSSLGAVSLLRLEQPAAAASER